MGERGHSCRVALDVQQYLHQHIAARSGPSKAWLKVKNRTAPGMLRFREDGT